MAKYSTGSGPGGSGGRTCELCGEAADELRSATVAGANLDVCPDCAPHDESPDRPGGDGSGDGGRDDQERRRRAAQNAAQVADAARGSSEHWENEGTDYEDDRLPYLVADYGQRVEAARQEAGYRRDELAEELDVDENVLLAIEQDRATQAGVGGSVVRALEAHLGITLVDE